MANDILDIEILPDVKEEKAVSLFKKKKTSADIINENLKDIKYLYDSISSNDSNISEKLNELLKVKTAMVSPMIQLVNDPTLDPTIAASAGAVIRLIDSIEQSLYNKANFELAQEVDFHHPKIQVAFKFIFEAVVTHLQDFMQKEEIDIFSQQLAMALTGMEDELNKRLKGISANILDSIENPLLHKGK